MELLLARDLNLTITEDVVNTIANRFDSTVMKLLLARDLNLTITEGMVTKIAQCFDKEVMEGLLVRKNAFKYRRAQMAILALVRDPCLSPMDTDGQICSMSILKKLG
jgi:hypothetical protein